MLLNKVSRFIEPVVSVKFIWKDAQIWCPRCTDEWCSECADLVKSIKDSEKRFNEWNEVH